MSDARIEPVPRVVIVGGALVALNWAWSYLTFQRGSRLITGLDAQPADQRQAARAGLHSKAS